MGVWGCCGNVCLCHTILHLCVCISQPIIAGDIAVLHKNDIVVLDTNGNLRYIPVERLPAPSTNYTRRCATTYLFKFSGPYSGYTGLSVGYRSDVSGTTRCCGGRVGVMSIATPLDVCFQQTCRWQLSAPHDLVFLCGLLRRRHTLSLPFRSWSLPLAMAGLCPC